MSEITEQVAKAIQAKCSERGYRECPVPLVHHVAGAAIEAMRPWMHQFFKELMPYIDPAGIDRQIDEALK